MSMTQGTLPPVVELLKTEGNTLYAQGSFLLALQKYCLAIEKVPDNAILYANRAACYLGLKRYLEAREDATQATKLDADYAKGWGRLASAQETLHDFPAAMAGYSRAISCLDTITPLSDANQKLREQYESHRKACRKPNPSGYVIGPSGKRKPWELVTELPPQRSDSSAWVIIEANADFETSLARINNLKVSQGMALGLTGGLESMTNAIIMDERCFYMKDSHFLERYNVYVMFEIMKTGAWSNAPDPQEVMRLAKQRLASSNWNQVRPALSVTIRGWIMRGFMGLFAGQSMEETNGWYERAISMLEMGRREWANVGTELRGAIFVDTFLRGVRRLHMNFHLQALGDPTRSHSFSFSGLHEMADAMLLELEQNKPNPAETLRPGFKSAFYTYCRGTALSSKAYCHARMSEQGTSIEEKMDHTRKSAKFYLEAAEMYPEDDEAHPTFIYQALRQFSECGIPARDALALMERIRLTFPKAEKIWAYSSQGLSGVNAYSQETVKAENTMRTELQEGKYTLDDMIEVDLDV